MSEPDGRDLVRRALRAHRETADALESLAPAIAEAGERLARCLAAGGTVFWMGNGGSAADAQHLAAELVGRFAGERRALRSVALTTDTSVLTSVANDYGYAAVFARQLEGLCREGDLAVGISTSGRSENVLAGLRAARARGAYTVGLTGGDGGEIPDTADLSLVVPAPETARVQEAHILIGHIWCEMVDRRSRL